MELIAFIKSFFEKREPNYPESLADVLGVEWGVGKYGTETIEDIPHSKPCKCGAILKIKTFTLNGVDEWAEVFCPTCKYTSGRCSTKRLALEIYEGEF